MKAIVCETSSFNYQKPITAKPCSFIGEVYAEMREMMHRCDNIPPEEKVSFVFILENRASKMLYTSKRNVFGNIFQRLITEPYYNYVFVSKTSEKGTILIEKELHSSIETLISENILQESFIIKAYEKAALTPEIEKDFNQPENKLSMYQPFERDFPKCSYRLAFFMFRYQRLLIDVETQCSKEIYEQIKR